MKFWHYFQGLRVDLHSPLPKAEAIARINRASGSMLLPFSNGITGGVWFERLRLSHTSCWYFDSNVKPILAGRLSDALGSCEIRARFRAPLIAYVFFAVWYLILLVMLISALVVGLTGGTNSIALLILPALLIFSLAPVGMHYLFHRNAEDDLERILEFLNREAAFFGCARSILVNIHDPRKCAPAQHQFGQRPDKGIGAVGTAARPLVGAAGHHPAQLVLQLRKHSGMAHAARFIERGDRFGPRDLAAAGVNEPHRQAVVGSAQHRFDHRAALVGLGDHPVGAPFARGAGHRRSPAFGAGTLDRTIGQNARKPIFAQPRDDNSAGISMCAGRWIDCQHHAPIIDCQWLLTGLLDQLARPQRALDVFDQFALQFLAPQLRIAEFAFDRFDETAGQVGGVLAGRTTRRSGVLAFEQAAQQRHAARRGCRDDSLLRAKPEAEQQIVPAAHGAFVR